MIDCRPSSTQLPSHTQDDVIQFDSFALASFPFASGLACRMMRHDRNKCHWPRSFSGACARVTSAHHLGHHLESLLAFSILDLDFTSTVEPGQPNSSQPASLRALTVIVKHVCGHSQA